MNAIEILNKFMEGSGTPDLKHAHPDWHKRVIKAIEYAQESPVAEDSNTFLVLTHSNQFIDASMLYKGLYATNIPTLYDKDNTVELMINNGKRMIDIMGVAFLGEQYFENLAKCKLTPITLSFPTTHKNSAPDAEQQGVECPTQDQFNKIGDIRPYLLLHPDNDMVQAACLHFLGDAAQQWFKTKDSAPDGMSWVTEKRHNLLEDLTKIAQMSDKGDAEKTIIEMKAIASGAISQFQPKAK